MFRCLLLSSALLLFSGCAIGVQPDHKRTLAGVTKTETIIAAGHALSLEGFNVESIDLESGKIVTYWEGNARKQVQYTIVVNDKPSVEDINLIEVTASAQAATKTPEGWGEPIASTDRNVDNILEKIVFISADRYEPKFLTEVKIKHESCDDSSQCQAGFFCGSQMCVYECKVDSDCLESRKCDHRGRCILPSPPAPEPSSAEVTDKATVPEAVTSKVTKKDISIPPPPPLPPQKQKKTKTNVTDSVERSNKNE
jgi:hypothetical protein